MNEQEKRLHEQMTIMQEQIEDRLIVLVSPDRARLLRHEISSLCAVCHEIGKLQGWQLASQVLAKGMPDHD